MGDPFRQNYGTLSDAQKADMVAIKNACEVAWDLISMFEKTYVAGRDFAVAKTNLQTSCMWAVRGITKQPDQD